MVDVKYSANLK